MAEWQRSGRVVEEWQNGRGEQMRVEWRRSGSGRGVAEWRRSGRMAEEWQRVSEKRVESE